MLVRLLGKEEAAEAGDGVHPFNDVPGWAVKSVAYLYQNQLTYGISTSQYGSARLITPNQYATFLLRALGYEV